MKTITILLGLTILTGCASLGKNRNPMLTGVVPLKGKHCESSAIVNMLHYQGYGISEVQLIGAGGTPGFMFELNQFPFLGGRNLKMKEYAFTGLEIPFKEVLPDEEKDHWQPIIKLLKKGNPVVLRVDMRYLPYLYGGKYGPEYMSFGWHMICLFGIDEETGTAYVTDTELEGLQEIKLEHLSKARFSKTQFLTPEGRYHWVKKAPEDYEPDPEQAALASLRITAEEMTGITSTDEQLIGLDGLARFPGIIRALDKQIPSYMFQPALEFIYGSIETNGTGGAAFRTLYLAFLEETAFFTGNERIDRAAELLRPVESDWHMLARGFKDLAGDKKSLANPRAVQSALKEMAEIAERIYEGEKRLYEYILNQ